MNRKTNDIGREYPKKSGSAHSIFRRDQRANCRKTHAKQKRRSLHKHYAPPAAVSNSSARFSTAFFARGDVLTRGLVLAVGLVGVFFGMVTCLDSLTFCRASSAASAPSTKPRRTTFSSGSSSIRNAAA